MPLNKKRFGWLIGPYLRYLLNSMIIDHGANGIVNTEIGSMIQVAWI